MARDGNSRAARLRHWDHLWFSAVAGTALGSWWVTFLICVLADWHDFLQWKHWVGRSLCVVMFVMSIASSPQTHSMRTRAVHAGADVAVCIAFAILMRTMYVSFSQLPLLSWSAFLSGVWSHIALLAIPALLARTAGAWLVIWIGALVLRGVRRVRRRAPIATCRACGFDQAGLGPHDTCPECGRVWHAEPPIDDRPSHRFVNRLVRTVVWMTIIGWFIAHSPWFVVWWTYRSIEIVAITGETATSTSIESVVEVRGRNGLPWWVGIAMPSRKYFFRWPTTLDCLETRVYQVAPSRFKYSPAFTEHGLMRSDRLRAIIETGSLP